MSWWYLTLVLFAPLAALGALNLVVWLIWFKDGI